MAEDYIGITRHLAPVRVINLIKLFLSYRHSIFYKKSWMWGLPYFISIEPNNTCQLHCPECLTGSGRLSREKGYMSLEDFSRLLAHLPREVFYLNLYFMGEPLLHPELNQMIALAKQKKLYVCVSTNGYYMDEALARQCIESGLDKLIVSVDGIDEASYTRYRQGGELAQVLSGIRQLVAAKKAMGSRTPYIVMQTLLLSSTEKHIQASREMSKELQVNAFVTKTAQFNTLSADSTLLPSKDSDTRYKRNENRRLTTRKPLENKCFRMWSGCVTTWKGEVVPCCFDKNADYVLGDLTKKTLRAIWKGSLYHAFRDKVLHDRAAIPMCTNCTEGQGKTTRS